MVSLDFATDVAGRFAIERPFTIEPFEGRGNINLDTLLVVAGEAKRPYLLQRVNDHVFPMTDRVMTGMIASIAAQSRALSVNGDRSGWQVPELVHTVDGAPYLEDKGTWRMMRYIEGSVSYKNLAELHESRRLHTAREVGRGLAIYTDLTAGVDASSIPASLPGYRDTDIYFNQLDCALEGVRCCDTIEHLLPDVEEVRTATERHFLTILTEEELNERRRDPELQHFIQTALRYRERALSLKSLREAGNIRTTAIHGDTKIENYLFDAEAGSVIALVDLDTVMPLTWLADWGDMVRSLVNVAGEKERDLSKVVVDTEVYQAVTAGFLQETGSISDDELSLMPLAVEAITLELGVRFLADYLRGDTYFRLSPSDPTDLNKVRAMVQIRLFEKLVEHHNRVAPQHAVVADSTAVSVKR